MTTRAQQQERILDQLAALWEKSPNLRFGQLVENILQPGFAGCSTEVEHYGHCIYQVTDAEALSRLVERSG